MKPWTDEELAWARECHAGGDGVEEIAEWSGRTVDDVERTLGIRRPEKQQDKRDRKREAEIARLWNEGHRSEDIGNMMGGITHQRVSQIVKRMRSEGVALAVRDNQWVCPFDPKPRKGSRSVRMHVERDAAIWEAAKNAKHGEYKRIAELHGVTHATVCGVAYRESRRDRGLPPRPFKPRNRSRATA